MESVDKRIDVIATAIKGRLTVFDLEEDLPIEELRICIQMALIYHLSK